MLKKIESNISEINKLKLKDTSVIDDISKLKKDVLALHIEDTHIFEILNELQNVNNTIKNDNEKINNEIIYIKERIEYLSGVNVDSIETLEGANRRLTALENADVEIKKTIDELKEKISDFEISDNVNGRLEVLENTDKYLQNTINDINENLKDLDNVNNKLDTLEDIDKEFSNEINKIKENINNLSNKKLEWIIL